MPRISLVTTPHRDARAANALAQVKAQVGSVPNTFATIAHSPAALDGYLAFAGAMRRGRLTARQRELVALVVAQQNECQYCLSAHSALAQAAKVDADEILRARMGRSVNPIENAILTFAVKVIEQRGLVSDADLEIARKAGIDDELAIEIIAHIALNTITNFTNRLADTEIDFPVVPVQI